MPGNIERLSVRFDTNLSSYKRDMAGAEKATVGWADATEKSGQKAEGAAKKSQGAFSRISQAIRGTRSEASKGANFEAKTKETGLSGLMNRIKGARSEAGKGADFEVRGRDSGIGGVLSKIRGARSEAGKGATFAVKGQSSGIDSLGSKMSGVRGDASRGATFEVDTGSSESKLTGLSESMKTVGETAAGVAGGMALEDFGSGLADNFREASMAAGGFEGRLGASKSQAEALSGVGKDVFAGAWGGSLGEVNEAVTTVAQGLGTMGNAAKTQKLTEQAMTLSDAFGMDVTESVEAARQMSQNFGISSERAFDLVAAGAKNGANTSGDLLDSMREYSPMFDRLGISGQQAMGMFAEGANQGIWNTDRLGDAVKEFSVRAVDGSDTTREGFKMAGLDANKMSDAIAAGGPRAQEAFQKTIAGIRSIEDPQKRAQAGVALFGTLYEDIGEKGLVAMQKGADGIGKVDGAAKKTGDSLYNNFTTKMQGALRSVQVFASDSGLGIAGSALGNFAETAGFAGVAVMGLGPVAMRAAPVVASAFTIMTGPVGLTIAAIAAVAAGVYLIYRNWGTIGPWFGQKWEQVKGLTVAAWQGIRGAIVGAAVGSWNGIRNAFGNAGQWAAGKFNALKMGAVNALTGLAKGTGAKAIAAKTAIVGALGGAKNRGVAVLGGLASGGVNRLTSLKTGGLKIAGSLATGTVNRFQQMKAGSHGRIQQLVAGGLSRFVTLQTRGLKSIGTFVSGGLNKYQQMRKGGATRFEALSGTIVERLGEAKTQGLKRISEFGSGAKSRWTNQWENAKTRYSGIRDTVGDNLRKGKEWGLSRIKELGGGAMDRWTNQWENAKDRYSKIRDTIGTKMREAKEWGTNRVRQLGGNLSDSFGNMVEGAKKFGSKWSGHIIDGVKYGVNKARAWMGGLLVAVGNTLGVIGADELADAAKSRGAKLQEPLAMASGGIVGMRDGGMASSPTVLYGEAGPEAYVRLDKRTPESQEAARAVMQSPNAPKKEKYRERVPHMGGGGQLPGVPIFRMAGGGQLGKQEMVDAVVKKWPSVELVDRHTEYMPNYDQALRSMDFFVSPPGTVAQGSQRTTGNEIAAFLEPPSAEGVVWMDQMNFGSGWGPIQGAVGYGNENDLQHRNHVHGMAWSGGFKGNQNGSFGGSKDSGIDWLGKITDGLKGVGAMPQIPGMLGEGMAGYGKTLLGKAKDYLVGLVKSKFGSLVSGAKGLWNNVRGNVDEWITDGLKMGGVFPDSDSNHEAMKGRVMQESGGDPNAINNWDSNAAAGTPSKGLVQLIGPTWESYRNNPGPDPGPFDSNWNNPVKSIAVGSRYMKGKYGQVMGATGIGYDHGGIIPGNKGAPKQLMAHAGEMVLPEGIAAPFNSFLKSFATNGPNDSLERLKNSVELWSSRPPAEPRTTGSSGDTDKVIDRLERLEERLIEQSKMMRGAPERTGNAVLESNLRNNAKGRNNIQSQQQGKRRYDIERQLAGGK